MDLKELEQHYFIMSVKLLTNIILQNFFFKKYGFYKKEILERETFILRKPEIRVQMLMRKTNMVLLHFIGLL
jgi:hypothetical protein